MGSNPTLAAAGRSDIRGAVTRRASLGQGNGANRAEEPYTQ